MNSLNHHRWAKIWLVLASLFFYGYFKWNYLYILIASILINYGLCRKIQSACQGSKKRLLLTVAGCAFNLLLLGYFKYTGFLFENLNAVLGTHWQMEKILLPLGISFYTFQQLSFLVDCHRGEQKKYSLVDYALFVTFFPQLIAGPIVLPGEMLPQFEDPVRQRLNWENINDGFFLFVCGLAKKCFIADSLAIFVSIGYDTLPQLTLTECWVVSLAFTFQLYFDFSGYCDMASGIAKFFNLDLPLNFNSPYRSTDFQSFWRRWHMTLGRFMMNYLYIPLGGNRRGTARTLLNLWIVFIVSGLWHGASWLFLIWGGLHGLGILIHRLWRMAMKKFGGDWHFPVIPAIAGTFFFVHLFWIFFRAHSFVQAQSILGGLFDFRAAAGFSQEFKNLAGKFDLSRDMVLLILAGAAALTFFCPNAAVCQQKLKKYPAVRVGLIVLFGVLGVLCLRRVSPFLYFNF